MSHDPIHVIATLFILNDEPTDITGIPPLAIVEIGHFSEVVAMGFRWGDDIMLRIRPGDNVLNKKMEGDYIGTVFGITKTIARHTDEAGTPFISEVHLSVDVTDGPELQKAST
ncbi:hypothetical protein HOU03_gp075 [Caulobacter phage CcrSC]|uniref:Uncharacterized protein n=1 Tax=Caulobacter phage CcrSC TaxID=2283272 RepID=A0A385EFS8_9CAUD|nr:hypothetical protein HOU03_gp075 [Caulobacter phage CcrSC]AXQ69657.1 hypothetical protein CcrSC_gp075c [Caulobacter phage CcrSC]